MVIFTNGLTIYSCICECDTHSDENEGQYIKNILLNCYCNQIMFPSNEHNKVVYCLEMLFHITCEIFIQLSVIILYYKTINTKIFSTRSLTIQQCFDINMFMLAWMKCCLATSTVLTAGETKVLKGQTFF